MGRLSENGFAANMPPLQADLIIRENYDAATLDSTQTQRCNSFQFPSEHMHI